MIIRPSVELVPLGGLLLVSMVLIESTRLLETFCGGCKLFIVSFKLIMHRGCNYQQTRLIRIKLVCLNYVKRDNPGICTNNPNEAFLGLMEGLMDRSYNPR